MEEENKQEENLIEQANKAAERIENANKEAKIIMERHERNRMIDTLSGKAEAGVETPKPSDAELKKSGAKSFFAGSEIEQAINKYG